MTSLTRSAAVCALVPHHDCAGWLPGALDSLLGQTRPPEAVVVVDDASPEPPLDVAARYPEVTFLRAVENVGPYRLAQTVVDHTDFDAYLFQDADDISHPERLAALLHVAESEGAEIVGSHEIELDVTAPEARRREYPLDVNAAVADNPIAFALLHPTSLVARPTLVRAGGFPGGLRFGGDVDLLWRAVHVARIANADRHLYVRRRHPASLTRSATTGTRSEARRKVNQALWARARARAEAVARGATPDLSPFALAPPVELEHLSGPGLGTRRPFSRPETASPVATDVEPTTGPVLVVGGPRSGADVLACALELNPRFEAVDDPAAVPRVAAVGRRAVLAGPAVPNFALRLADARPGTRVLCVERDAETTVASLLARPDAHENYYSERSARSAAAEAATTSDLLAAALGPHRVLRVALAELVADPPGTLLRCLAFLGEDGVPGITAPLVGLHVAARPRRTATEAISPSDARRLLEARAPVVDDGLAGRLRRLVAGLVHDGDVVAVVSRGDDSLLDLGAGQGRHLPATDDGTYAGEYPATGAAAAALVEAARAEGATHLLVPAPASWWLTHYAELRGHLDHRYAAVAAADDTGVLYDLRVETSRQVTG